MSSLPKYNPNPVTSYPDYSIQHAAFAPGKEKMLLMFFDERYTKRLYLALYDFRDESMIIITPPEKYMRKMYFQAPKFSHDGSKIALTVTHLTEGEPDTYTRTVALLDTKTFHIKELTPYKKGMEYHSATFSHDDKKLIYVKASGRSTRESRWTTRTYVNHQRRVVAEMTISDQKETELFGVNRGEVPHYRYGEPGYLVNGLGFYYIREPGKDALVARPWSGNKNIRIIYHPYYETVLGYGGYVDMSFDQRTFFAASLSTGGYLFASADTSRSLYENHSPDWINKRKEYGNIADDFIHIPRSDMKRITKIKTYPIDVTLSPDGSTALIVSNPSNDKVNTKLLVMDVKTGAYKEFDLSVEVEKIALIEATLENTKGVRYD